MKANYVFSLHKEKLRQLMARRTSKDILKERSSARKKTYTNQKFKYLQEI
jgi:hypothetical protein